MLRHRGYVAEIAGGGAEALMRMREHRYDLILLDLSMPDVDGWAVIGNLKADPQTDTTPVLALTALKLEQHEWETAGFCGYLRKPVLRQTLLAEVERCIGRGGEGSNWV